MKKRPFIYILLILLFMLNYSDGFSQTETKHNSRQIIPFNHNWTFYFAYDYTRKAEKQKVTLPHTWNAKEPLQGVADYKRSSAIYENKLEVTEIHKNKRLFLYFEGANSIATVLVNNRFVSEHKGGYTGFCIEITDYIKPGSNAITVQVSNAYRLDIIPLHGDFNIYGGIHRPVSLLMTSKDCISPLDYGSSGIYLSQKNVSEKSADLEILTKLSLTNSTNLKVKTTILDRDEKAIKTIITDIKDNNKESIRQNFLIENPHLWNGKENPYLYTAKIELLLEDKVIDEMSQPLGFRYFKVDPNKGFFLNGKYLNLYGVGRHEDIAGKGSALSNIDHDHDMELIKELGATSVRLTHYPQNQHFYNLSNKNGIILWTEIPFVGPGGYTGTGYIKNKSLESNIKQNLIELIRQNYNHPSICFWGLFNELKLDYDDPQPFIKELDSLVKKEDPSRLTTIASNLAAEPFSDVSDLMAWNKYYGWYEGNFKDIGNWADETHKQLPHKPIAISEYGAGASPLKHLETLVKVDPNGKFHPEEWQTAFHEVQWEELKKRPFIWSKLVWVLADFGSSIRTEGDNNSINDKGLVTYDRTIKKDAFYFYKANWNKEPMLYLAEKRNSLRTLDTATIKAYSNLSNIALRVNGTLIKKANPNDLNIVKWENVPLKKGKNLIEVKSSSGNSVFKDSCEWILK